MRNGPAMHSTDDASTPSQTPGSAAPSSPDLSVVIPAYNEERRLFATLRKVCAYLDGYPATWELIVVDDGSSDATARLAESIAAERP